MPTGGLSEGFQKWAPLGQIFGLGVFRVWGFLEFHFSVWGFSGFWGLGFRDKDLGFGAWGFERWWFVGNGGMQSHSAPKILPISDASFFPYEASVRFLNPKHFWVRS